MALYKATCPACKTVLQTSKPFTPGAKARCPKCAHVFVLPGGSAAPPAPPPRPAAAAAAPRPPAPPPAPDDEDLDEEAEERPRPRKAKRKKGAGGGLIKVIVITFCLGLVGFIGVIGYVFIAPFLEHNAKKDVIATATSAIPTPNRNQDNDGNRGGQGSRPGDTGP